jgi:pilus assembly protein Flp/PilA
VALFASTLEVECLSEGPAISPRSCAASYSSAFSLMKNLVQKIWADETGATAIEYGLIAVGIALAIIAIVNGIGGKLNTKFSSINSSLK